MKYYSYNIPGDERGEVNEVVTYSEEEILTDEWDSWSDRMERMYGPGHAFITKENCIADWVIEHWAWESEPPVVIDFDILEGQTEQWFPVLGFRWLETKRYGYASKSLQQQYLSNTGKEKWVDIPTVTEE